MTPQTPPVKAYAVMRVEGLVTYHDTKEAAYANLVDLVKGEGEFQPDGPVEITMFEADNGQWKIVAGPAKPHAGTRFNLTLSGTIDVVPLAKPPTKPTGGSFTFTREGINMTGRFSDVTAPAASEKITALSVVITVAGVAMPAVDILDLHAVTFDCVEGDLCVAVVSATNETGTTAGDPIAATATIAVPLPSKPVGGVFTFQA